jgi:polyhydroxyalkanoate synthesis regulator phasin
MPTDNNLAERIAEIKHDLKLAQLVSQERMSVDTETVAALIARVEQLERENRRLREDLRILTKGRFIQS